MKYYLGLDNGGTMTKAALYDKQGKEIAVSSMATEMIEPAPGFVERDMNEMWEANCKVISGVIKKSGISPEDIGGVAVCGHGKGLYLWGKDEKPVRNGIISTDNRAWQYAFEWKKNGVEQKSSALACQHIMSCQPIALLAWLKDHEPECLENLQWIFEAKDYIRYRLTGEAKAELGDYSGANLINLHTQSYDGELLKLFGLEKYAEALPPLCRAAEICGYITEEAALQTGLKAGTPVAGGLFDIDACMLAADVLTEEKVCMIAGTWSVALYLSKTPVTDRALIEHIRNTVFVLPEYYLREVGSPTSAGNSEWFLRELLPEVASECRKNGTSIYDITNEWVREVPVKELCPVFIPFLFGSNMHPNARGSFVGINSFHTRKHLMRSVYEGIAFSHKIDLERLLKSYPGRPEVIRLTGGITRSEVWTQMFADVMNIPIEIADANETGTLGCAIVAAAASGEYESVAEAAGQMSRISKKIYPNPENVKLYSEKYALYIKTLEALDDVWDAYQNFSDNR